MITAGDSEESISATSATTAESASLEVGGVGGVASSSVDQVPPYSEDPLQPPSWETHANTDRDTLEDVSGVPFDVCSAVIHCSLSCSPRGPPHRPHIKLSSSLAH